METLQWSNEIQLAAHFLQSKIWYTQDLNSPLRRLYLFWWGQESIETGGFQNMGSQLPELTSKRGLAVSGLELCTES